MKKLFFLLSLLLAFTFCSDDIDPITDDKVEDEKPLKPNEAINSKLFEVINLDYPGLEKAKQYYENSNHYNAAKEILEYYRNRTNIINPSISLISTNATEGDKLKADYALNDNRFFVNNYYEDKETEKPYSLTKNGEIDWTFQPKGADDEYQKQLHRHQWFVPQAKVYRTTKDEKYIQSWIKVYKDWLENNPKPASGTNNTTWWQLQVSSRVYDQTQLFDYFKHSINFTPEWMSEFIIHFADHANFLVEYPYTQGGNILISQANALAFAGVIFPELKDASKWLDTGYGTLGQEMKKQFLDDGMHFELDLSYHIGAIANFYEAMKLADANPSITSSIPTNFRQPLHKPAKIVQHFTFPGFFNPRQGGYLVPGFNDTRQTSWTRSVLTRNFTSYVEMFNDDQELLYMSSQGKQGVAPNTDPKAFTTSGYYVLRNGWEPSSTMMILSNNYASPVPRIWSHNQLDNGTFELYHNGRNFFPDTGVYSYYTQGGDNSDRAWFRQTRVHNTMTLNGKDITDGMGKSLKVISDNSNDIVAFENQGYSNLKHRRYVFYVNKEFFVIVDEGIGQATGTVNLNFNLCEGTDSEVVVDESKFGSHTAFSDKNNITVRSFANNTISTKPFEGKVSYNVQTQNKRKSYSLDMVKSANETARYITVIYPTKDDAAEIPITASFKDIDFKDNGVSVEVNIKGQKYELKCNL